MTQISEIWHDAIATWSGADHQTFSSEADYLGFCAAKDLIQDTAEAIIYHRTRGFPGDYNASYIELLGLMQAIVIQQDSIRELYRVFGLLWEKPEEGSAWEELRTVRNLATGHPARSDRPGPLQRCVLDRLDRSYSCVVLHVYSTGKDRNIEHRRLELGSVLDRYDDEAARRVTPIAAALCRQLGL